MHTHNRKNRNIFFTYIITAVFMIALSGCATQEPVNSSSKNQLSARVPGGGDTSFAWLQLPSDVDAQADRFTIDAISANGQVAVGTARRTISSDAYTESGQPGLANTDVEVFRWNLDTNRWDWLGVNETLEAGVNAGAVHSLGALSVALDFTASTIAGHHWVWQDGRPDLINLGPQFWAYAVSDEGQLLGVQVGNKVALRSAGGDILRQWPVADLFVLDDQGLIPGRFWFSSAMAIVNSTVEDCLKDARCTQGRFIYWTPDAGAAVVNAQMPSETSEGVLIQSNPGPQLLSRNARWAAGFVGEILYLWDVQQGGIQRLGGFDQGGTITGMSDDGLMIVGFTMDSVSNQRRDWVWTATEGLGWLDEWLHSHGVAQEQAQLPLQSRLLSANRRTLIGTVDLTQQGQGIVWWRVALPEHLRVLVH